MDLGSADVAVVYSAAYVRVLDKHPAHGNRNTLWASLCKHYGLWKREDRIRLVEPTRATRSALEEFHTDEYLDFIDSDLTRNSKQADAARKAFGLVDDCYVFEGLRDYMLWVTGGSLTAARELTSRRARVAVNWGGGRHHAMPGKASGFCYVNDIALAALRLSDAFGPVLYIDIDVHHGDGVEKAFWHSDEVFTLSFHRHGPGFFPGTGCSRSRGAGAGALRNLNIPLLPGVTDRQYVSLFSKVLAAVAGRFRPRAVIMQCGCDGLARDRLGGDFNLTTRGIAACVHRCLQLKLPTLLVGGGGYHPPSAARCWAQLTAIAARLKLPSQIPTHEYSERYAPSFELHTRAVPGRQNFNTQQSLNDLAAHLRGFFRAWDANKMSKEKVEEKVKGDEIEPERREEAKKRPRGSQDSQDGPGGTEKNSAETRAAEKRSRLNAAPSGPKSAPERYKEGYLAVEASQQQKIANPKVGCRPSDSKPIDAFAFSE